MSRPTSNSAPPLAFVAYKNAAGSAATPAQSPRTCGGFHAAMLHRRWCSVDRWENARIHAHDTPTPVTRGEWIDALLSKLLDACAQHEFSVSNDQQLRDDVFDFVRSLSRKS